MKKSMLALICVLLCMFAFTAGVSAQMPDILPGNDNISMSLVDFTSESFTQAINTSDETSEATVIDLGEPNTLSYFIKSITINGVEISSYEVNDAVFNGSQDHSATVNVVLPQMPDNEFTMDINFNGYTWLSTDDGATKVNVTSTHTVSVSLANGTFYNFKTYQNQTNSTIRSNISVKFSVDGMDINTKPRLVNANVASEEKVLFCGESYSLNATAVKNLKKRFMDPDGDTLTYRVRINNGEPMEIADTFSYQTTTVGTDVLQFYVNDGKIDSDDVYTVTLNVKENHAPVLKNGVENSAEMTVPVGASYEFTLSDIFTDEDGQTLSYSLILDGGETTSLGKDSSSKVVSYKNTWNEAGTHTLVFSANDGVVDSVSYTVQITVSDAGKDATVWDGSIDTSWYNGNDEVFVLTKPAQLAGLAAIVNGSVAGITDDFSGKTVKLGNNIVLNDKSFVYYEDVNRVQISDGTHSVYLGLKLTGSTENAPANTAGGYYSEKNASETMSVNNYGFKISANQIELLKWTPIGNTKNNVFKGTFDGQNHSIKGLYVDGSNYVGLFGNLFGTVKNITTDGVLYGNMYVGAVSGYASGGSVENCINKAIVYGKNTEVGGFVGFAELSDTFELKNLDNRGNVEGKSKVGGIIGRFYAIKEAKILDCRNSGTVNTSSTSGDSLLGGVIGSMEPYGFDSFECNVLIDCVANTGNVGNLNKNGQAVGGIIGGYSAQRGYTVTKNCYNTGNIYGSRNVGGLIGHLNFNSTYKAKVESSYNAGNVIIPAEVYDSCTGSLFGNNVGAGDNFKNLYYTKESFPYEIKYSLIPQVTEVSEGELKEPAFVGKIGEKFAPDRNNENNGFPVFVSMVSGSNEKDILSFSIGNAIGNIEGRTIKIENYEVSLNSNILTVTPVITLSEKSSVSPASNVAVDFKQSMDDDTLYQAEYCVTAENGSQSMYIVSVYTKASVSGVTLDQTDIRIVAGYLSTDLCATVAPVNAGNKTVIWSSSNDNIATVDENGVVTGVSAGNAVITVKTADGEKTATCNVTVTEFVSVESVSLPETASVPKNSTITLTATVTPENASNQTLTWSSEDTTIAKVDENGVVTGMKEGTVTITATTVDGEKKASCNVTVENIPVDGISVSGNTSLMIGKEKRLKATISPSNATNKNVIWSSSDDSVATVNENGVVKGIKAGEVTITAKSQEKPELSASATLTVCENYSYNVDWAGAFNSKDSNNNISDVALPTNPELVAEKWNAEVSNSTVVIIDNYVYTYACAQGMDGFDLGGETGTFYKIDKNTGDIVDTIKNCPGRGGYYYGYTIYGDGMIYVSTPGMIMAFDIDAFEMVWTCSTSSGNYCPAQYVNGYVVTNGKVVDGAAGKLIKDLPGDYNWSNGAVVGNYFYVADYVGTMYAFDTNTWEVVDSCVFKTSGSALQPGVMYHNGRLYWGDAMAASAYSVKLDESGAFDDNSLIIVGTEYTTTCTPVAYGDRIYLAGQKGSGSAVIGVFNADTMQQIYTVQNNKLQKFQGTPILYADVETGDVYVYAQAYYASDIYFLKDTAQTTENQLKKLCTPSRASFAFEQLACDSEGAIYVSNDAGYLFKFAEIDVAAPMLDKNLNTEKKVYCVNEKADALEVSASVNDGGTLSYQWQQSADGNEWVDVKGATDTSYVPVTNEKGTVFYRCIVTNTLDGIVNRTISNVANIIVVDEGEETITVTFRLIGATKSSQPVDFSEAPGEYYGSEYQNWIKTTTYEVEAGTTVYDVMSKALAENGMTDVGGSNGYVSSVTAPAVLGGEIMSQFTNGLNSGWQYTINGFHPNGAGAAVTEYVLKDGDAIVFHYVNDYMYEDESTNPNSEYLNKWLEVPDVAPGTPADPEQPSADQKAADKVEALISAIGNVTKDSKTAIDSARTAYNALTADQKALVENYNVLTAAEAKYAELNKPVDKDEPSDNDNTVKPDPKPEVEVIDPSELPFTDVKADEWYADEVAYVLSYGLMNGTGKTTFEPETNLNRAMMATILYRIEGEPAVSGANPFSDVEAGQWYTDAIIWAAENGIVKGMSETTYEPNTNITREQMAVMMYRYAAFKKADMSASDSLAAFSDAATVSDWANEAMKWAVAEELINGMGNGTLAPQGNATRAQAAAVLMRFNENIVK